ncbi:hypothetical protein [Flavobacterium chungangense]|uniref:Uncharacterized protein n=1 Tax=Flavobacterium chungangense TaxID=554283 RepID=A0A6V6Z0L5_9FLAO|nr:hypothetical protein [Flavobacterium chungangense]CAD0004472.1 hypothetical protein FLACHUCJ7_01878 [Flavobacterium chungangense]
MKKLLLFLVLAVTFNLSAQTISTTYFAKPLELNSVPASTSKADSVIVRGADKILKFVPRSEFGGSSTLQDVLNKDAYAEWCEGSDCNYVEIFGEDNNYIDFWAGSYDSQRYGEFGMSKGNSYFGSGYDTKSSFISFDEGILSLEQRADNSAFRTKVTIDTPVSNSNMHFPAPISDNDYYLITSINGNRADSTGNIEISTDGGSSQNLQELLDEGSAASNIDNLSITGSNGVINIDNSGLTLWAPKVTFNGEINQSTTNFVGIPKISQVIEFYNDYSAIQNADIRTGLIYSHSNGFYFGDSNGMYISSNNNSDTGYINFEGGGNGRLNLGKQYSTLTAVSSSPFYIQNTYGGIDLNAGSYGGLSMNPSGVQLQNRGNTSPLIIQSDKTLITGIASLGEFIFENLPTPSNTAYATVLDATSPAYLTPIVGGGNIICPVFFNGTEWVAH